MCTGLEAPAAAGAKGAADVGMSMAASDAALAAFDTAVSSSMIDAAVAASAAGAAGAGAGGGVHLHIHSAYPPSPQQIRESVRALCAKFPGEYWRALDRERGCGAGALGEGRTIQETDPKGPGAGEIACLWDFVQKRMELNLQSNNVEPVNAA